MTLRYMKYLRRKPKQTGNTPTKGWTYGAIAGVLNDQGFKTKEGKDWSASNVAKALSRDVIDSDDLYHSQEEIDEAFKRMMPASLKQLGLLGYSHGANATAGLMQRLIYPDKQHGQGGREVGCQQKSYLPH